MFEILQPKQWGGFCSTNNGRLVVGKKIREGAQANIFEAEWITWPSGTSRFEVVMKESREITPLNPRYSAEAMAPRYASEQPPRTLLECWWQLIQLHMGWTMLNNGRFAFWIEKCRGDLRKIIQQINQVPPFLDCD